MFHVRLTLWIDREEGDVSFQRDIELPFAPIPSVNTSPGSENNLYPGFAIHLGGNSLEEDPYDVFHVTWHHVHGFFEAAVLEPDHLRISQQSLQTVIDRLTGLGWEVRERSFRNDEEATP